MVVRPLAVAVALLGLAACGPQTPEQAYVSALRHAEPNSASTSDDKLITMGRAVCLVYEAKGAEGVATALDGVLAQNGAETRRIMGAVSLAATTHLCPKKNT